MIRRMIIFLTIALSIFVFTSCAGPVRVSVRPDTHFTTKSTITVVSSGQDPMGVQGRLENLLMSHGFEVVSEAVARDRLQYEDVGKSDSLGNSALSASVQRIKEIKAEYILKYSYSCRADFPSGTVFSSFNASVVDLASGRIVATADFSQGEFGGKTITGVLEAFVHKLAGLD